MQHLRDISRLRVIFGLSGPTFPLFTAIAITVFCLVMKQDLSGGIREIYAIFTEFRLDGPNYRILNSYQVCPAWGLCPVEHSNFHIRLRQINSYGFRSRILKESFYALDGLKDQPLCRINFIAITNSYCVF